MFVIYMDLFCRHIPQCTVPQEMFLGHVSNLVFPLCTYTPENK